jgi:hypothetical protein
VLVQIGHRRGNRPLMVGLDRFVGDVVGQGPQQRHAFGRGKGALRKGI